MHEDEDAGNGPFVRLMGIFKTQWVPIDVIIILDTDHIVHVQNTDVLDTYHILYVQDTDVLDTYQIVRVHKN